MKHWLVEYSEEFSKNTESIEVHFLDDFEDNAFLNDIVNFPHAFVLACCMDRRIKADRAWRIPCIVRKAYVRALLLMICRKFRSKNIRTSLTAIVCTYTTMIWLKYSTKQSIALRIITTEMLPVFGATVQAVLPLFIVFCNLTV